MIFSPKNVTLASVKSDPELFSVSDGRKASLLSPMVILPYLAATILSLVSFHTTYYGMRSFYELGATGNRLEARIFDPIANSVSRYLSIDVLNLFAICFAAVVQGGILLASAYLFRLLLNSNSRQAQLAPSIQSRWLPRFVSVILLLLLPISIVFSYGARLEWQIGPEQKTTIQASGAYSDATSMTNTLKGMMAEESQRLSTSVTELPAFKSWMASMEQLTKAVAHAPDAIRTYLKSIESAEAEERAIERSRQAQASQQTLDFDRQADGVKSSLEAIQENIRKLEPLTQSKPATIEFDDRIARYEAEMKKEQDGTGSCGPAGEGGCFKRYKANRDNAAREKSLFVESANAAARTAADRLTALKKDKIDKEVELANIIDKARLAGHEITIDPRAGALDVAVDLPKKIADLQLNIGKYGIELRQALDALSGGFTPDKYARVAERCRNLIPITMVGDFTKTLKGTDCEPSALAASVSAIEEFEARQKRFEDECQSLPPYVGGGAADAYAGRIFDRVSTCIELSGLGTMEIYRTPITDLSQKLAKSISNRSTGVDYLTFTTGELRDGKRVAFLALFFAFAVDALVLVFTFLGELPRLSTTTAPASAPLSNEERQRLFVDLQAVNDALDTSDPARFKVIRGILTCLKVGEPDSVIRLDIGKLPSEMDRQALWRRLIPFLSSGLAWNDPRQKDVTCMSDRAMSLLIQECRHMIAREEKSHSAIAGTVIPLSVDRLQ